MNSRVSISGERTFTMKRIPRKSLRTAINTKCTDCVYDPQATGTKLQQITLCSCNACPLWMHRPLTKSAIPVRVVEYFGVRPDDACLAHHKAHLSRAITRPGTQGQLNGDTPIQHAVTASQSGKVGLFERGSRVRTSSADMSGRSTT